MRMLAQKQLLMYFSERLHHSVSLLMLSVKAIWLQLSGNSLSLIKQFIHNNMTNNTLEMLSAREQLMEDIISIVSEGSASGHICEESSNMLQTLLCDAVCRNFPTK